MFTKIIEAVQRDIIGSALCRVDGVEIRAQAYDGYSERICVRLKAIPDENGVATFYQDREEPLAFSVTLDGEHRSFEAAWHSYGNEPIIPSMYIEFCEVG